MEASRVLVIDDAEEVLDLVSTVVAGSGYETRGAGSGGAALTLAREWNPDVVVLDLSLPDMDGVEVCRELRTFSDAYVLMLTARSDEIDRVVGLRVGADDYVTKPFSPRELQARIDALMRRRRTPAPAPVPADEQAVRRYGPLELDPNSREIRIRRQLIETTKLEFDLLDALTEQPRRVMTRAQLRNRIWGESWFGDDHTLDVHVSNLRRKLAAAGTPVAITTVRGVGYRLAPELLTESS